MANDKSNSANLTTKDLNRVLGFGDLLGAAVGQIIGAGLMGLMGTAIAMTGRSAMISFMLGAMLVCLNYGPAVFSAGTVRLRGGYYTQATLLGGTTFGGIVMFLGLFQNVSLSMYALSFADYFLRFIPNVPSKLIAFLVFTFFWLLNMFGIDKMAKIQNLIVILMCAALGLFAAFGFSKVQPGFFSDGFMPHGFLGLFQAAALLTFATSEQR
jgi:APA family basic amino acid/polyamine antiporter